MTENLDEYALQQHADNFYRAIGRFLVQFELLVDAMRLRIIMLIHENGLQNQSLSRIMVADLTAEPILRMLAAIIPAVVSLNDDERRILKDITKEVGVLIEERNNIVHGTWYVVIREGENLQDYAIRDNLKKSKKGLDFRRMDIKADSLDELSVKCNWVAGLIISFYMALSLGEPIAKWITRTEDGELRGRMKAPLH